nr:hypothetical protein [uncultured Shinella sp.]
MAEAETTGVNQTLDIPHGTEAFTQPMIYAHQKTSAELKPLMGSGQMATPLATGMSGAKTLSTCSGLLQPLKPAVSESAHAAPQ